MKRLLLLIILSVGFTNVSYASNLCPDGSNAKKTVSADGSYYTFSCVNPVPPNAHQVGIGWTCNQNYYKRNNKCSYVPSNSTSSRNSNYFKCNKGFKKSGHECIPKIDIPKNAKAFGSSWTCVKNFYRNDAKTACLKAPLHATSSSLSNSFKCNTGYKKSANKCISNSDTDSGTLIAYGYVSNFPMCKGTQESYMNNCVGSYKWSGGAEDGWEYYGEWKNNKRHGVGIFYYKNPDHEYFGESRNDAFSGQGILTFDYGDAIAGNFSNDFLNGLGVEVSKNGQDGWLEVIDEGIFKDDFFQSFRQYVPKNASKKNSYVGSFIENGWTCNPGYQKFNNLICLRSNSNPHHLKIFQKSLK